MATNLHSETENVHVAPNLDQLPAGLRILVVDDDVTTLKIIEQMSIQCQYHVTTCTEVSFALNLLRERKGCFDVVLSDVHMPDMDGYKFLQHVDQEFDIPVVMMSVDESTSSIMEGIRHGACHYLIKPVHQDDMRNIWQHIVRKTRNQNKEHEDCGGLLEVNDPNNGNDDPEYISSDIDGNEGVGKDPKKRILSREGGVVDDNPSTPKKQRFVWTPERHQLFVDAVLQLGIDKAVPKRILALMNMPDLTRENVASHLQKFRLHMKKKHGEVQLRNGKLNATCAGHVSPQTQAHAELTGSPAGNIIAKENQVPLLRSSSLQEPNYSHAQACAISKCDSNIANNFPQPIMAVHDASSGYGAWEWPQSNAIGSVGLRSGIGRLRVRNGYMLMNNILQRQQMQEYQQKQQQRQLQQSMMQNQIHCSDSINIQPSYLMAPSQPSETLQVGNSPAYVNHNYSFGRNSLIDYSTFSPQMNNSLSIAEFPGGYATPASVSPPVFSSRIQQLDNSTLAFGAVIPVPGPSPVSGALVPYGSRSIDSLHQGQVSIETQPNLINSTEVDHAV